jgi:hypothetical protein
VFESLKPLNREVREYSQKTEVLELFACFLAKPIVSDFSSYLNEQIGRTEHQTL